mmetsp:Transcript_16903/g.53999  ORF Transcript_16903/g.53999 Transcript_16903/m.53999 type:complete len:319 (+) Transcript_16903:642-1598(+)
MLSWHGEAGGTGVESAVYSPSKGSRGSAAGHFEEARLESDRRERSCTPLLVPSSSAVLAVVISGSPGSRSSGLEAWSRGARGARLPSALSAQTGDWARVVRSGVAWSFSQCASARSPSDPSTAALVRCLSSRTDCWTSLISVSCLLASCCIAETYFTTVSRWPVFWVLEWSTLRRLFSTIVNLCTNIASNSPRRCAPCCSVRMRVVSRAARSSAWAVRLDSSRSWRMLRSMISSLSEIMTSKPFRMVRSMSSNFSRRCESTTFRSCGLFSRASGLPGQPSSAERCLARSSSSTCTCRLATCCSSLVTTPSAVPCRPSV